MQIQKHGKLKELGYNVFIRDLSSEIYETVNTTNFILGTAGYLYLIYPYGNSNFTDAMDVVVFQYLLCYNTF